MEAANKAMEKKNQKLEDKFKDSKLKLEEIEKHSSSIISVNAENEELEAALQQMKRKHHIQEQRIGDIVKSLELIENQNALNSKNLSTVMKENLELKSALSVLESQNEHLKTKERNLKQKSAEAKQNFTQCQESMGKYLHLIDRVLGLVDLLYLSSADLENVNSNCKSKIRELNVCKTELTKLSSLVEEKLAVIADSRETATDAEQRSSDLERDLQQAKTEIDRFSSSLGRCCSHKYQLSLITLTSQIIYGN